MFTPSVYVNGKLARYPPQRQGKLLEVVVLKRLARYLVACRLHEACDVISGQLEPERARLARFRR